MKLVKLVFFLFLFLVALVLMMKLLSLAVGIAMFLGVIAIVAGLLYVFFGPSVTSSNKSEPAQIVEPTAKSVQEELKRRQREMQR